MTLTETGVIFCGLFFGYWIISAIWPKKRVDSPTNSVDEAPTSDFSKAGPRDNFHSAPESTTWHDVLGVLPIASEDIIRDAYRSQIAKYHPDKVENLGPEIKKVALEMTQKINAAYEQAKRDRNF